jgi:hypothetical protein
MFFMSKALGIQRLTLAGFQVFDQRTTIPFSRIMLLYGPNSAGKSALEDALRILGQIALPKTELPAVSDSDCLDKLLLKNWRRIEGFPPRMADFMEIDADFIFDGSLLACMYRCCQAKLHITHEDEPYEPLRVARGKFLDFRGNPESIKFSHPEFDDKSVSIRYRLSYEYVRNDPNTSESIRIAGIRDDDFLLEIDNSSVITSKGRTLGVHLAHPLVSQFKLHTDFKLLTERYGEDIRLEDGWLLIKNAWISLRPVIEFDLPVFSYGWGEEHNDHPVPSDVLAAMQEVKALVEGFLMPIGSYIHAEVHAALVPASRSVPNSDQLVFLFDETSKVPSDLFGISDKGADCWISDKGADCYRQLAESLASRYLAAAGWWGEDADDARRRHDALANDVNRSMSDHLFRERAYQISADYRLIFNPASLQETLAQGELSTGEGRNYALLVRLHLVDPQQRQYDFAEVGSGLGYILPVLCETWGKKHLVLIQQPELHLHPALQSELGDVFIEASEESRTLVVETHSEHLLLRLLRRIRQTANGQLNTPELMLRPDDVCVLYFDPEMNGTTKVRQLRISNDGDFLDLWPKGFFAERWNELFDE